MSLLIVSQLSALIGAVFLFRLRKQAYYFFVLALILKISIEAQDTLQQSLFLFTALGSNATAGVIFNWIGILISWGILIAICFYIKRLEKIGLFKTE